MKFKLGDTVYLKDSHGGVVKGTVARYQKVSDSFFNSEFRADYESVKYEVKMYLNIAAYSWFHPDELYSTMEEAFK